MLNVTNCFRTPKRWCPMYIHKHYYYIYRIMDIWTGANDYILHHLLVDALRTVILYSVLWHCSPCWINLPYHSFYHICTTATSSLQDGHIARFLLSSTSHKHAFTWENSYACTLHESGYKCWYNVGALVFSSQLLHIRAYAYLCM